MNLTNNITSNINRSFVLWNKATGYGKIWMPKLLSIYIIKGDMFVCLFVCLS